MPVNLGPLELAIIRLLPLLCGGMILLALVVIIALMVRRKPSAAADPQEDAKDS